MSVRSVANGTVLPVKALCAAATIALLTLSSVAPGNAADLRARIRFDESDLRIAGEALQTRVSMNGTVQAGGGETPELPMDVRQFHVPAGFEVAQVRVLPIDEILIAEGVRLSLREEAVDPEDTRDAVRAYPVGALVAESTTFPAKRGVSLGQGTMAGHTLHSVAVFPVRYESSTGDVFLAREIDVELDLRASSQPSGLVRERFNPEAERSFARAAQAVVENPWDVPMPQAGIASVGENAGFGFAPLDLPSAEGSAVDMVIVTTSALEADFQVLADWKTKKGVPTVVKTVSWINANYPAGHDQAERTRMFLQDAYSKWGTYLLLLGGDMTKVTPRLAYNRFFFGGTEIPTDQYFACLEGDWNADGDDKYGEGLFQSMNDDQVDLFPDLFVGRASVDNSTEAQTFVNKSMTYDKTPPAGYAQKVCYLAEVLFPSTWEFGEDPPESIQLDGATLTEGFDALVPPAWTRTKRYQVNNSLSRSIALSELSSGHHHLMTLMNHGDAFKFSVGNGINPLVYSADTDTLSNGDYLMFMMATACNPNQIDLECQGESLMNNPNGGAICVLGPTREDFPLSASNFHEEMLGVIFDAGITRYGEMNQVHRLPFVSLSQSDATPDRWTMLTKELLGDPEVRFWTQEPQSLLAGHAANLPLGTSSITITITDTVATPVPDAVVCVSDGNGTYARGRTDGAGQVTLDIASSTTGTVDVVATAPEFKPVESSFTLDAIAGPTLALTGSTIDDDGIGGSVGNNDGVIDAGETIELALTAFNGGGSQADNVTVTGTVEGGSSATFDLSYGGVQDPTKVFVGPDRVNPGAIPFTLDFANPSIAYIGTPNMSMGVGTVAGDKGIFLWQDLEGWHLRWSSGTDTVSVTGTVVTDGRVRGSFSPELESGTDSTTLSAGQDSLSFAGTTSRQDRVDGVDFALADSTMIAITSSPSAMGNIAASTGGGGTVAFSVASNARPRQIAYVDLEFSATNPGTWNTEVAVAFAGPELDAYIFVLDDSNNPPVSGDGDGVIEVGETVRITPTVLNRGDGYAPAVAGSAVAGAGISFVDAADAYGDLASLGQSAGVDGFVFTVLDSTGTTLDLTLTDTVGRTWLKTIDFVAPAAPDSIAFRSSSNAIVPYWNPNAEADLAGYNIYRSATSGSGHTRQNFELLRTSSRYEDGGLAFGSGFYYYATAVDSSGNESVASAEIFGYTTQVQVPGWPNSASSNVFPSIAMADADGVGSMELFVGSKDFKMYGWASDGDELPGFPVTTNGEIWSTPALADLDNDGDLEIMWGASDSRFYVTHHDGTPVFGANRYILDLFGSGSLVRGTPSIADVDGDSKLEFFVGTESGRVYAFDDDGTGLTDSTGLFYGPIAPGTVSGPIMWGSVAIADWDNDGTRELSFTSFADSLYVVDPTGADLPGWPKGHGNAHKSGPVFADLDNDGTMELMSGCSNGNLYIYDHDGSGYLAGNPIFASLPNEIIASPSPCQLDGDPELELIVTCLNGDIYAYNHDGTGFLNAGGLFVAINDGSPADDKISTSAIVVDVDGDGDMEIFVGHRNHNFYGFHHDGSTVVGMPILTSEAIFSTAAAGDLDGDGDVDVAFASYDQNVYVLDFAGASTPAAYEWATYSGSISRRSVYGEPGPAQTGVGPTPLGASFRFGLAQSAPNPFVTGTSIRYSVPRDMHVSLNVYSVEGRLVRTLINGNVSAGAGQATWDGRDAQGRALASGVYFYRLKSAEEVITRKTLLLR